MSRGKDENPGDDDVGYGKPPRHTRFKPGQSGNPRGRPKRAKGKHQQLVAAMDQPTRDMFMAEMQRPITVTSDGRKIRMPTIQMIVRSMARTAANDGQQAQRTAILLQLELERQAAADNAECMRAAREVKDLGNEILAWRRAQGLPEPELVPHPDDIFIDEQSQRVEVRGPFTAEQKAAFDKILEERDACQRGVMGLQAEAAAKPRDWTVPMFAVMAQEHFDVINDILPKRYRKKLENRMTESQVEAARDKARKGLKARKRRRGGVLQRARDVVRP